MTSLRFATVLSLALLTLPSGAAQAQVIPELATQPAAPGSDVNWLLLDAAANASNAPNAIAQTSPAETPLKLSQQWGARFETGPEVSDSSGFGELFTFIPFSQVPGESTFFFEGQARLFTYDSAYASNAKVGYRRFEPGSNLVWGGYVGADFLKTGYRNSFGQLGLGAEVMAEDWEARFNAYLPIGDRRQNGPSTGVFTFTGNSLFVEIFEETSMLGFDLEAGYRLLDWQGGSLFAHAGPYFLDANTVGTFVGVRGRLEAEFGDRYRAGLVVSSDGNFGTNIVLQIGATLGRRPHRKKDQSEMESVLARMARPIQRQDTIAVDRKAVSRLAVNPLTGQAYRFFHVQDGAVGGDGTAENPFGEVTDATAVVAANQVIYVDSGDRSGLDGFTIPNSVQVLSSGVDQSLDFSGIGTLAIPGTGTLPLVNGATGGTVLGVPTMVVMGENSTLSGFEVNDGGNGLGIGGADTSGYTITQNRVTSSGVFGGIGIATQAGTASGITVSNNTVTSTAGSAGILVLALGGAINNITVADNTVTTTGANVAGINIFNNAGVSTISDITLSGNTVTTTNTGAIAINIANNVAGATITNINILNNTLTTATTSSEGLFVTGNGATTCIASFTGNTLTNDAGSRDSDFAGTVDFVGLSSLATNNPGFDDNNTAAATVNDVTSC
ncbi:MAG: inverse autotransporter beta domain-containing protein [Spirulinaceae cyanobacterium]